jgi:hypothetical protein
MLFALALLLELVIRIHVCQAPCTVNYRINIDDSVRGELCLVLQSDDGLDLQSCFPAEFEGRVKQGQWRDLPAGEYRAQVVTGSKLASNVVQMTITPNH